MHAGMKEGRKGGREAGGKAGMKGGRLICFEQFYSLIINHNNIINNVYNVTTGAAYATVITGIIV